MQHEFSTRLYKHPPKSRFKPSCNELSMFDYLVSIEKIYQTRFRIYFWGERLISLNFVRHIPVTRVIILRSDVPRTSIRIFLVSKVWHVNRTLNFRQVINLACHWGWLAFCLLHGIEAFWNFQPIDQITLKAAYGK